MADDKAAILTTIETLIREAEQQEAALNETRRLVNSLCRRVGRPEPYVLQDAASAKRAAAVRPDQFADQPAPSTAVRAFLEWRGKEHGAATLDEIFTALKAGGFAFTARDDEKNKGGLRVAIGKDVKLARIGPDAVGLAEWYPRRPRQSERKDKGGSGAEDDAIAVPEDSDEGLPDEEGIEPALLTDGRKK